MSKDYYKILGVAEFDSAENIKNAYRRLARKWHPDIAGEDAISRFKEINEAYEILSNKAKKAEYDRARKFYNYAKSENDVKTETSSNTTNPQKKEKKFNFSDFFSQKAYEKNFEQEIKAPKKGQDVYSDIDITVFEAVVGVTKTINMLQTRTCPKCKGRKFVNGSTCPHCNGKGDITSYKKFTIKIPAEVTDKSKIRLAGEGGIGQNGGANGDLYLVIHIQENKEYKTEGLNILKTVPITPYEAVLGAQVELSTLNGNIFLKISPNTQNGQKFRLAGCGIVQNEKVGDMIVTVEIRIPKNLSEEEISLYKKLAEISSSSIRD